MTHNKRISPTVRKGSPKTAKRAQGELIYGFHPVLAALRNTARNKRCLWLTREARKALGKEQFSENENDTYDWRTVSRHEIDAMLARGSVHQGICLNCAPLPAPSLEQACTQNDNRSPVLLLDQVSDPQNVGAILRSAAAFGARAVVLQDRHSPATTGSLAKAASGALETVPLIRVTNIARAMEKLKNMGYWLTGLHAEAGDPIGQESWRHPVALVLGAEGSGLRRLTQENCDSLTAIKIADSMHSLNVSTAAAIALYALHNNK